MDSKTPFKVHSINYHNGVLAALAAHGFYVISTTDGSMLHDGEHMVVLQMYYLVQVVDGFYLVKKVKCIYFHMKELA